MGLLDILLWGVVLAFAVKGVLKGLVREVCSLLGFVVGGWAAFSFHPAVGGVLVSMIHLPARISSAVAFVVIFLGAALLFYLLGHFLTVVMSITLLGGVNRVGGAVFGLLEGAFLLSIILYLASAPPVPAGLRTWLVRSATARAFIDAGKGMAEGWRGSHGSEAQTSQIRAKDVKHPRR